MNTQLLLFIGESPVAILVTTVTDRLSNHSLELAETVITTTMTYHPIKEIHLNVSTIPFKIKIVEQTFQKFQLWGFLCFHNKSEA